MLGHKQKLLGHVLGCAGAWLRHWSASINTNMMHMQSLINCLKIAMIVPTIDVTKKVFTIDITKKVFNN